MRNETQIIKQLEWNTQKYCKPGNMLLLGLSTYLSVSNDSDSVRKNTGHEAAQCGAFYEVDTQLLSSLKEDLWGMRWEHITCRDGDRLGKWLGHKIPGWGFSRIRKRESSRWLRTLGRCSCPEGVSQQALHLLSVTEMTVLAMCDDFISTCKLSRDKVRAVRRGDRRVHCRCPLLRRGQ